MPSLWEITKFAILALALFPNAHGKGGNSTPDLYIVFVNPAGSGPGSIFGHIFLIIEDRESFHLSSIYNMNAVVGEKPSFLTHLYKGVGGKYLAEVREMKYYEFIAKHNEMEDRDVYIFKVRKKIPPSEIFKIIAKYKNKPYFFISKNCATFVRDALNYKKSPFREDYPYFLIREMLDDGLVRLDGYRRSRHGNLHILYSRLDSRSKGAAKKRIAMVEKSQPVERTDDPNLLKFFSGYYDYRSTKA